MDDFNSVAALCTTTGFDTQKVYVLTTEGVTVPCINLRINRHHFSTHNTSTDTVLYKTL